METLTLLFRAAQYKQSAHTQKSGKNVSTLHFSKMYQVIFMYLFYALNQNTFGQLKKKSENKLPVKVL